MAIVGQIARNDGLSLAAAAQAYAKLGITVTDAFITIFHAKYLHNLLRPVTYIQPNIPDAAPWLPYLMTPPNPSYSSGHSTQSMAAAGVLTDLLGDKAFTVAWEIVVYPILNSTTLESNMSDRDKLSEGAIGPFASAAPPIRSQAQTRKTSIAAAQGGRPKKLSVDFVLRSRPRGLQCTPH
jgi:hypothetical protein